MFFNLRQSLSKRWGYDANEQAFLKSAIKPSSPQELNEPTVIFQAPEDYYILALCHQVKETFSLKCSYRFIALRPTIFSLKQKYDFLHPFRVVYSLANSFFRNRKWIALYQAIGIDSIHFLDTTSIIEKLENCLKAIGIWKKIKRKEDLINLSIDDMRCGDLIYDTYLRYRIRPTVHVSSISLLYYIYKCICVIDSTKKIIAKYNVCDYFSSYSTYIEHGVPVRVFLKYGINVFTMGNLQQRFKKLSLEDQYHTAAHKKYYEQFKSMDHQAEKIASGKQLLGNKFKGIIDSSNNYMLKSAYHNSLPTIKKELGFDGVLFLHDFYDSPHIYSGMLFPDFYEWAQYAFQLIAKYNLNIGVKPHPNQIKESRRDIESLKRKYPLIKWIDPKTSNIQILNSGIKFGISVYGTVLHELAYHGINPICAGDNPHASFEFVHSPKTRDDFKSMILNFNQLKLPENYKEQVAAFYYMHNVHPKEDFIFNDSLFKNYNIINGSSELLLIILQG